MNEVMKLTERDKRTLEKALKDTDNMPVAQGKVLINITPEGKVGTVEINYTKR